MRSLTELPDTAFSSLVVQDIQGTETERQLRQPENVERWYTTLVHLKRSMEESLRGRGRSELSPRYRDALDDRIKEAVLLLDLTCVSDDTFDSVVNQDVRGDFDDETGAVLRQPIIAERWYDMLLHLKRAVEAQLTTSRGELAQRQAELLERGEPKTKWLHEVANNEKWRQGAIRFKNGVEDRLAEAKRLRNEVRKDDYVTYLQRERDHALALADRYRAAILNHRNEVINEQDDDDTDDRLYEVLDKETNVR